MIVVKLYHLGFLLQLSSMCANLYHIAGLSGGQHSDGTFVLPLQCHCPSSSVCPHTPTFHSISPPRFNCQRHSSTVDLCCLCEGQTSAIQLHCQLWRGVESVCDHMVAKTLEWLSKSEDDSCSMKQAGITEKVSLCAKVQSESLYIPCSTVSKDKCLYAIGV